MCGICGIAGLVDRDILAQMTAAIAHRGPNDSGIYCTPNDLVGLGNRRLSIIDLSPAGHMPMCNEDASVWLTYNGEIYNFKELRRILQTQGHVFKSDTDSEVILHGYEQWGSKVLNRLDGMFAFALWDDRKKELMLARDRFGIKPLYYTQTNKQLFFASEIKSLLCAPDVKREVDLEALHKYLAFLWVPGPETLFKGIAKLPPGHFLIWHDRKCQTRQYWDLCYEVDYKTSEKDLTADLREILRRAVKRHMVSDVPLGVFLSGGIDSTGILALASECSDNPIACYTIAYRPEDSVLEQSSDDSKFARMAAKQFNADYHEFIVDPDIVDLLPKVIWHLDEPVADPASIATYLISQAAQPNVKVLLSGQGGDEIFAGYRVHLMHQLAGKLARASGLLHSTPVSGLLGALPRIKDYIPGIQPGLVLAAHRYIDALISGIGLPYDERYVQYRSYYTDDSERMLYSSGLRAVLTDARAGERHLAYFNAVKDSDAINQLLYVDAKTFLPELNLTYSDKLTMAASVEARVPFLDLALVEFMAKVPAYLKLKGFKSKYILRKALDGLVPDAIIKRRKAGFGAPIRAWLRGDLREMVGDLLSENNIKRRGYFNPKAVHQLIKDDANGMKDNTYRIWALLTLELWHRTFIDDKGSKI